MESRRVHKECGSSQGRTRGYRRKVMVKWALFVAIISIFLGMTQTPDQGADHAGGNFRVAFKQ